jgi:hypothetical protein
LRHKFDWLNRNEIGHLRVGTYAAQSRSTALPKSAAHKTVTGQKAKGQTMTEKEMTEALAAMRAENARLQAQLTQKEQTGTIKISPKGGVSVYGMGQFPVTLYRTQWERLFKMIPDVQAFIQANASKLAEKPAKVKA